MTKKESQFLELEGYQTESHFMPGMKHLVKSLSSGHKIVIDGVGEYECYLPPVGKPCRIVVYAPSDKDNHNEILASLVFAAANAAEGDSELIENRDLPINESILIGALRGIEKVLLKTS